MRGESNKQLLKDMDRLVKEIWNITTKLSESCLEAEEEATFQWCLGKLGELIHLAHVRRHRS